MFYQEQSDDYRPFFWIGGRPVYANTLALAFHITAFVVSALCISWFGGLAVYRALALITPDIWHGEVWRLFSYVAYDPGFFAQRSLWVIFSILLLYFFGREVEQFVGRKGYLKLYGALVLVPAILLSLLGLLIPQTYLNCCDVFFGFFVAFATIYPGAMPWLWVPVSARAMVWVLLAVCSLIDLAVHDFTAIFMLWASSGVAYASMRLMGVGSGMNWLTDWIEERRTLKQVKQANIRVLEDRKEEESIDEILEKISKHGVASLDARERAALERARANLLKRDSR
jgi:hypothetical protein